MKSDCHTIRDHVSDWIASTLSDMDEQAFRKHLETCADCRKYVGVLEQEDDLLTDHFARIDAGRTARQARVLETLRNHYGEPGTDTISIWRGILKRRISRLAIAAAAVFAIAMGLRLCGETFRATNTAYALDQTVVAMKKIHFVHVVRRNKTGVITEERWIEIGPNGQQTRYRCEMPGYSLVIDDGKSNAEYQHARKAVVLCDRNTMPYQWIGALGAKFENLRRKGIVIEEDVLRRGRRVHKVWWPMMREVCYVDPDSRRAIAIGNVELSYEAPPAGTFDIVIPDGYTVIEGPLDRSRQAAEKEGLFYADVEFVQPAQASVDIVNRNDVVWLYPRGDQVYEGTLDMNIKCTQDVSLALSIRSTGGMPGTYSCALLNSDLTVPGGLTTVAARIDEDAGDNLPSGGQVATVKLAPFLLPDPTHDARAWQRLGFAFYDARRYEEALDAFEQMQVASNAELEDQAIALTWQGHMLDLLDQRDDAVERYQEVLALGVKSAVRHDQYGLAYDFISYPKQRLETPFTRVENHDAY